MHVRDSCNKTKVARLTLVIEIWIHVCLVTAAPHMYICCIYVCMYIHMYISMTKVNRATFVLLQLPLTCTCLLCVHICIHISMTKVNRATFVLLQLCAIYLRIYRRRRPKKIRIRHEDINT